MNVKEGARSSTRRCKLGLDWVCSQQGQIASLLDGIDFEEILRYDDRKLAKMFGDGAESFEKTITFSEIRHILRHFDQFCPEEGHQTVTFYRKGEPLSREDAKKLCQQFDERSTAARERKKQARAALEILEKCDSPGAALKALKEHQEALKAVSVGVVNYLSWLASNEKNIATLKSSEITDALQSGVKARNSRIDKKLAQFGLPD